MPPSLNSEIAPYPEEAEYQLESMGFHVDAVNAFEIAESMGNSKMDNIIVMGILSRYMPFIISAWEKVIKESVPAKTIDVNLAAFHRGREIMEGKI